MTNDEKAKAYDMALEAARKELGVDRKEWEVVQRVLRNIFPELRESEDERIRKEMIAYFAHRADVTEFIDEGEDCKRWIAYLEKQKEPENTSATTMAPSCWEVEQKEQKPIDYPYLPGWRKNRDNNKPELKRSVLMLTTHGVAEGEWLGEKWCQYRWSCELKDGEVLYWIHLSDLERLEKEGEEKQQEQKPTWSEEDSKRYISIGTTLETSVVLSKEDYDANMSWLRNLVYSQKYSRPKPQEEIYQSAKHDLAIKFMNYLDENRPEGKMSLSNAECEDIDKAFKENDWAKILIYAVKYGK